MDKNTKNSIITALEVWLKDNEFSANEFSAKSGVPANYLSYMRRNVYSISAGENKEVAIDDKYFRFDVFKTK